MTSTRTSLDRGPLGPLARYLTTNALVTAIAGGLVILGLTAASAGVYDAVAEKNRNLGAGPAHPQPGDRLAYAACQSAFHRIHPSRWPALPASQQLTRAVLAACRPERHEMPNSSLMVSSPDMTPQGRRTVRSRRRRSGMFHPILRQGPR
jgi:hypothetical protein